MNSRATRLGLLLLDEVNFLVTNRVPRALLTRFMGWFSKIRQPLIRDGSITLWRWFGGLDLRDAKKRTFVSVHDCFTRELADGARPVDGTAGVLASPCDAIVGACGPIASGHVVQAKGSPYPIEDLLCDADLARSYRGGCYATLRLTAGMYHRFHAPYDCTVERVTYVSGDTWNVNPAALARIERLFCQNERAVIRTRIAPDQHAITLVPVAAILVASIRLRFLDVPLNINYRGANQIPCRAGFGKGEEMGWFEHGSTLIVFAPPGFALCEGVAPGTIIRVGRGLMRFEPKVTARAPECAIADTSAAS